MKKATTTGSAPKTVKKAPANRATSVSASAPIKAAEVVKAVAAVRPTAVVAKIDVGFGNLVYIRGEGPGLNWDRGVPMECAGPDTWKWTTAEATRPFAYKMLVNDERWSTGDDYIAAAGTENSVTPTF